MKGITYFNRIDPSFVMDYDGAQKLLENPNRHLSKFTPEMREILVGAARLMEPGALLVNGVDPEDRAEFEARLRPYNFNLAAEREARRAQAQRKRRPPGGQRPPLA
jgi:hypothetical protein